ncbi:MAG: 50S ribosomal protein L23 [Candidatus Wildermuthbacteria bacterium RIFCSPHIGHO2_12_FULL_45_9]|uniref:50S ribosomal protein L23 n=1 Tax=Candidatus Wildermuthbacteria bacterium RIFCSPHIGHO2_02_FULL_45_25 TaxID=1802450 RepID=A0A1G2R500_9BACT|nr:MAG: 50S ribosomal protein L23 [Candidatus Wildermuthbacteria bacterium RIFCSPHIGHO2_01_FULL_45_20]OHA67935.1 MAG: 50S ribosomal protein L23 [Candidatus Wildermuthbacteria bacterium RIFCSPHIGHO2_02_FULL_45_25]OHA70584.1 MAG: 50S ribosomal protein L23 [Candidatus Wildermuthbacteria bacterium RIFCSPHIGHO2_12_FULL_45_9]
MLAERNRYVFVVSAAATKGNIKEAVRATYGVSPVHVNIVNIPAKKIRVGRRAGIKKGYKKAIVQLPEGQKIDILPT